MHAIHLSRFGLPAEFALVDAPEPTPGEGEVVVEMAATAVSFPDVLVVKGEYQKLPRLPFVPGTEFSGEVREAGTGVTTLNVGDRVAGRVSHGALQARIAVPAKTLAKVPDGVSLRVAASFGISVLTAYQALHRRARVQAGDRVLVTGASGSVGAAAVQLAHLAGATVIAAARDLQALPDRLDGAAAHVVSGEGSDLRDAVRAVTGGLGVDIVVETVGGATFDGALSALSWDGRLVTVGFAGGDIPTIKAGRLLVKNVSVLGLQITDYWDREPDVTRSSLERLLRLAQGGDLRIEVGPVFTPENAAHAIALVASGKRMGKVLIEW